MNIEFKSKEKPMSIAELIERLLLVEDKTAPAVIYVGDGQFNALHQNDVDMVIVESQADPGEPVTILCLNSKDIESESSVKQDEEEYSVLDDISQLAETVELAANMTSGLMPETEIHFVTNIESLNDFNKHKSKAIRYLTEASRELIIMADVVMVDEQMECGGGCQCHI